MNRYSNIKTTKNISNKFRTHSFLYKVTNFYPEVPFSEDDIYVITEFGDRLDLLSDQFYGNVRDYWIIAIANPQTIDFGSLYLRPNLQIRIPTDTDSIKSKYKKLNQL